MLGKTLQIIVTSQEQSMSQLRQTCTCVEFLLSFGYVRHICMTSFSGSVCPWMEVVLVNRYLTLYIKKSVSSVLQVFVPLRFDSCRKIYSSENTQKTLIGTFLQNNIRMLSRCSRFYVVVVLQSGGKLLHRRCVL